MVLTKVLLCIALVQLVNAEVCYPKYGCFSNRPPFNRLLVRLPKFPDDLRTTFRLFTRAHRLTSHGLDDEDVAKLLASDFDGQRRTLILIHGYQEHSSIPWMNSMRAALLEQDDINLITTDWSGGSGLPYIQATGNARLVGVQVAELIKFLVKNAATSAGRFYIVGFGLGAHIGGYAGRCLRNNSLALGRITGLDPAGPFFYDEHTDVRLDPTDADFVDVIHTDGNALGTPQVSGHIDFFPNGGVSQPRGCKGSFVGIVTDRLFCDHMRCPEYYTESVMSACPMHAYPCSSEAEFEYGRCMECDAWDCPLMGYKAELSKDKASGKHFLETSKSAPFCVYHYKVSFKTGGGWFAGTSAPVIIKLIGTKGDTGDVYLKSRSLSRGSTQSFVALSRNDVGDLSKIDVRFNGVPYIEKWHLVSVVVKPGWKNEEYTACFNSWLGTSGDVKDFQREHLDCK